MDQSAGHNHVLTHNLEIAEWDEHRPDVMDVIAQKCERAYPPYFALVVLGRNGKRIDVEALLQQIRRTRVPFGEIWIMGRTSDRLPEYEMPLVHPNVKSIPFDLPEAVHRNRNQINFMELQGRGRSTDTIDLGLIYLP